MKTVLAFLTCCVTGSLIAQNNLDYTHTRWSFVSLGFGIVYRTWFVEFSGTTFQNGHVYQRVIMSEDSTFASYPTSAYAALIREEGDSVFAISNDPLIFPEEHLIYDFSMDVGDSILIWEFGNGNALYAHVVNVSYVQIDGLSRKRIEFDDFLQPWIQGIGSLSLLHNPWFNTRIADAEYHLLCVNKNGSTIYDHSMFEGCYINNLDELNVVQEIGGHPSLSIYPNPASEQVTIRSNTPFQKVEVFDLSGHLVLASNQTRLNVSDLAKGAYLVRTDRGGFQQLIVQHP